MRTAAIILAGGQGSRLGGVRKADLEVGGRRLLDRVLDAVAGSEQRIVVGYEDLEIPDGVIITREDPPGSGPAAGVAAGMAEVGDVDWVFTLACDLPAVAGAVPALLDAAATAQASTEAISASSEDRWEWLVSIHRAESLREAIRRDGRGGVTNGSMRRLYADLEWERVSVTPTSTKDIDTWEDYDQWTQSE